MLAQFIFMITEFNIITPNTLKWIFIAFDKKWLEFNYVSFMFPLAFISLYFIIGLPLQLFSGFEDTQRLFCSHFNYIKI